MHSIHFRNQASIGFKLIVLAATFFLILAITLFLLKQPDYLFVSSAGISILLFASTSYDSFRYSNLVGYDHTAITLKLMGRKTMGFLFKDVEQVDLSDKGLLIRVKGMDVITLSRKRYQQQSLEHFYNIIIKNKQL